MAMSAQLLPCGRDPWDVADHAVGGGLDAHERDCPWCQGVAAAASASARFGSEAAAAEAVDPPPDLVPGAMRSVRTELRAAREIAVPSPDGAASVTDHVVASVLRDALDAAGGLVVGSCRVDVGDDGVLTVRIEAYGSYHDDLPEAAAALRLLVAATLQHDFALQATGGVDIAVVDLIGPTP